MRQLFTAEKEFEVDRTLAVSDASYRRLTCSHFVTRFDMGLNVRGQMS